MADYRTKYKEYYGIEFDESYDIHHIDLNRSNNDIENLLLLPRKLHEAYHAAIKGLCGCDLQLNSRIFGTGERGYRANAFVAARVAEFAAAYTECQVWLDYKRHLDGELPNIHGIIL